MFQDINWTGASNLTYLPLFLIVGFLAIYLFKKRVAAVSMLVNSKNSFLISNYSRSKEFTKLACAIAALVVLFAVLLNPSTKKKAQIVEQMSRDVFVVLDTSRSMLSQDVKPSRLEFTKSKVRRFVNMLPKDRVGLVLFASDAYVQCPLTVDHSAFNMFLGQIDKDTVSGGSTSLASALQVCIDQCKKDNTQSKIVVIFTDGEDFSSDLLNVKKQAKDLDLKIFAVGVGTKEGATIPKYDIYGRLTGSQKDKKGNEVISKLNEGIISNLADEFDGTYVSMTESNSDLKKIVREIKKFDKQKVEDKSISSYESVYQYFALVALLLLLVGWLL